MSVQEWFEQQCAELQGWWDANTRHGCFCGAGSAGCAEPIDGLDAACEQHDIAYGAVGVSADTMWEWESLKATVEADEALAAAAAAADLNAAAENSNPDVESYRDNLIWLFSSRASVGRAARDAGELYDTVTETVEEVDVTVADGITDAAEYASGVANDDVDAAGQAVDTLAGAASDTYDYVLGDDEK